MAYAMGNAILNQPKFRLFILFVLKNELKELKILLGNVPKRIRVQAFVA